ncbi:MAG: sarcosine oxidase subunit gamma [Silicimonas sp.]|nr:sarcosine oxidase subunit gamma [Silicimonas sp.]
MSDVVTALDGATFNGTIAVEDAGLTGMITLRGDFASTSFQNAVTGVSGVNFPGKGEVNSVGDRGLAWMSPDELLMIVPYDQTNAALAEITENLGEEHHLAVNVSDARAVFRLRGNGNVIREVLAKLTPADLRVAALPTGRVRRTRLSQVPAAFWFSAEDEATLICFRSVAEYVFGLLRQSAAEGSEIGYF